MFKVNEVMPFVSKCSMCVYYYNIIHIYINIIICCTFSVYRFRLQFNASMCRVQTTNNNFALQTTVSSISSVGKDGKGRRLGGVAGA